MHYVFQKELAVSWILYPIPYPIKLPDICREFATSIGNKATDMAKEFVQQIRAVEQIGPVHPQRNHQDNW